MLIYPASSDHLPPATLPNSTAVENKHAAPTQKSVGSLISFFDPSLSKDHVPLLAAAEQVKSHFQSLPATEKTSLVTERIIRSERGIAQVAATSASETKLKSISVINALCYNHRSEEVLSAVVKLESRLSDASEKATQNATYAFSATQKEIVQVNAKSAVLNDADARLALAQLRQLESNCSGKSSQQDAVDLQKAKDDYQKASNGLASCLKTIKRSFEIVAGVSGSALASNDEMGITDEEASGSDEENKGPELKSALTAVGSPLIDGSEKATQNATYAFSARQEEMVQVNEKSAVLNDPDARLSLASNEGKEATDGKVDRNSFANPSYISSGATSSVIEDDNESLDDGGDTWRWVGDDEEDEHSGDSVKA